MTSSGSAASAKRGEAAEVGEDDGHLAPVGLERILGAAQDDRRRRAAAKKRRSRPSRSELLDLLTDAALERPVPLAERHRLLLRPCREAP